MYLHREYRNTNCVLQIFFLSSPGKERVKKEDVFIQGYREN